MKNWIFVILTISCIGLLTVLALSDRTVEVKARKNLACSTAKLLNRENPVFEELTTGWGFTPDTCLVQSATKQGDVRVPTSLVWCSVGVGQPVCLTLWPQDSKK